MKHMATWGSKNFVKTLHKAKLFKSMHTNMIYVENLKALNLYVLVFPQQLPGDGCAIRRTDLWVYGQ